MSKSIEGKKNKLWLKILIVIVIIIAILAGLLVWGYHYYLNSKLDKVEYVALPEEEIEINTGVKEALEEYRTIALLGLDTDDSFSDSRTDCIMLVTINNTTKAVKLTSIYRDTYVDIDGYGLDKINHAYAYGSAKLSLNTINRNLDLNVKEFVTVNFETVKTIVDAIGGVTINVTDAESKTISGISGAGTYNLNGAQALSYSRIRKIDTDYKRTERMRTVLTSIFEKVKNKNIAELNSLVDLILPHVSTNLDKSEIKDLITQIFSYNISDSIGWPYEVRAYDTPTWYGVPVTLEENVKKLHHEVFGEEDYEVSDTVKSISEKIIDKTGYSH